MAKKKQDKNFEGILIKRYSNRRLYNTESREYVSYEKLAEIIRDGADIIVIDSKTNEDVTKTILIQLILEEEKRDSSVLPTEFLFQVLRSSESSIQDFFKNHLSISLETYLRTREELDSRFRSMLELAYSTPQIIEKIVPGAETVKEMFVGTKPEADDKKPE